MRRFSALLAAAAVATAELREPAAAAAK